MSPPEQAGGGVVGPKKNLRFVQALMMAGREVE